MEDHHKHQYGMPDELLNGRSTNFQEYAPHVFSSCHRELPPPPPQESHHYHFDMMQMVGTQIGAHQLIPSDSIADNVVAAVTAASTPNASCGFDGEATAFAGDAGTGRWPRIMSEEYRYRMSGETCKENTENLCKYYKNIREVKAGRHNGKHHRFFQQLEPLNRDNSSSISHKETHLLDNSFSLSISSGFDTYTSDDNDLITAEAMGRKKKRGNSRRWKVKIEEFMDSQMKKLMERQEAWIEKLSKTLEQKEKERVSREEEWRKEAAVRIDREHKFWAKERAWIEARDAALMEALQNLTGKELKGVSSLEDLIATEMENQKTEEVNRKRKNTRCSDYDYGNNDCEMNDQQGPEAETVRLRENEVSSPSNCNAGSSVNENCFLFFMADGKNL